MKWRDREREVLSRGGELDRRFFVFLMMGRDRERESEERMKGKSRIFSRLFFKGGEKNFD